MRKRNGVFDKDGDFEPVSWDEAFGVMADRLKRVQKEKGPTAIGMFGWQDSAVLAEAGIPTVVFGPGGEGAHAVVEWADLGQAEQCSEVLRSVAEEFCG